MRLLRRYITVAVSLTLLCLVIPTLAGDLGNPKDVQQVRQVVSKKFGKVLHVSVSHDWALCTAYSDESDLSVVLHRTGSSWKVKESDGGAFDAGTLKGMGVPGADVPTLLKAYQ
ncbi:MAG: hypothetical protein ACR2G0_10445 [Chthoniobacterales bacterium]